MVRIVKYVLLALSLIATGVYLAEEYHTVGNLWYSTGSTYFVLVLMSLILYLLFLRRRLSFFENLQHEGTHLIFAILSFRRVSGFYVSATTGAVDTSGNHRSGLITLSPYFFPLLPILLIVIFSMVDFHYSRHLVITSYGWYLAVIIKNFSKGREEIYSYGIIGVLTIIVLNFWVSQFVLSWCLFIDFNLSTILKTIYHGIT